MKKLVGVSVAKGMVVASVHVLYDYKVQVAQSHMGSHELDAEYDRFIVALQQSREEIDEIVSHHEKQEIQYSLSEDILQVHRMFLDDVDFHKKVKDSITRTFSNAEWAVKKVIQGYIDLLAQTNNEYMTDRIHDFNEIGMRIIRNLSNDTRQAQDIHEPRIIVAHNLFPTQFLKMKRENIKGIILEEGGATSHIAIIAKAYGIPMIIGVKDVMKELAFTYEPVVMLGGKGEIFVELSKDEIEQYKEQEKAEREKNDEITKFVEKAKKCTREGESVQFHLNIDVVEELTDFSVQHSDGIGLFRSEFLLEEISQYHDSEEDQFKVYKNLVTRMGTDKTVTIRTFDAGGDKLPVTINQINEENPILGFRGVRYCLGDKDFFLCQLRAILRASVFGKVRILIPLVSCVDEMIRVRAYLKRAMHQLDEKGMTYDKDIAMGIMIEVPSIVYCMDDIGEYCDFYSVGTNDLLQYIMATDRGNPFVADLYNYYHPPFLRMLSEVFYKAHQQKKDISLCGEMASYEKTIPLLLAMGLRTFSVSPSQLSQVIMGVTSYTIDESRSLLEDALTCHTSRDVIKTIEHFASERDVSHME